MLADGSTEREGLLASSAPVCGEVAIDGNGRDRSRVLGTLGVILFAFFFTAAGPYGLEDGKVACAHVSLPSAWCGCCLATWRRA